MAELPCRIDIAAGQISNANLDFSVADINRESSEFHNPPMAVPTITGDSSSLEYSMSILFAFPHIGNNIQINGDYRLYSNTPANDNSRANIYPETNLNLGRIEFYNFYAYVKGAYNYKLSYNQNMIQINPCGLFVKGILFEIEQCILNTNDTTNSYFTDVPYTENLYAGYTGKIMVLGKYDISSTDINNPRILIGLVGVTDSTNPNQDFREDYLYNTNAVNDYVFIECLNVSGGIITSINNDRINYTNNYNNPTHQYYYAIDGGELP